MRTMLLAWGAAASLSAAAAYGQLTATSQVRTVHAHGESVDSQAAHMADAPGAALNLGPYIDSVSAGYSNQEAEFSAVASQNSSWAPNLITLRAGASTATTVFNFFSADTAMADAHSNFFMTFNILQPGAWQLDMFLNQTSTMPSGGTWLLTLTDLQTNLPVFQGGNFNGPASVGPYNLVPGPYSLQYDLDVQSHITNTFSDQANFYNGQGGFDFYPVPAPGTMSALLLFGAAAGGRRRSR